MSSSPPSWPHPGAATAGLLPWLIPVPSYRPTTAIQTVAADLGQHPPSPWPSHIIVIDDQHRPQGCLALGLLWACQRGLMGQDPAVAVQDCLPWLEPVVTLVAQTAPAELSSLVPLPSPPCWVVVDGQGQYLGVVNVAALVAQGQLNPAPADWDAVPARLATASVQEQQWVMAISHALKTPLTSLLGLSTLLLDHRVGPLNDRQSRYAGLMRRAIRKLIRLINQLVDWMRLEAGQLELDATPLDLKALTETLLSTFLTSWLPDATAPPDWMAAFRCPFPPDLPPLRADRLRLQQSLFGVLGYLLHRGAIPQTLTIEPWGAWVGLTLWAIPTEAEPRAARPWTVTLGAEVDGMETLGLALARRLCQQQGGDLVGFCSPRDGYQITLLLPREPTSEGPGPEPSGQGDPAASEPIPSPRVPSEPAATDPLLLLVSADGSWLAHTQERLAPGNSRLLLATHWDEALDLVQRLAPGRVLLDAASLGEITPESLATLAQIAPATTVAVVKSLAALDLALAEIPGIDGSPDHALAPGQDQDLDRAFPPPPEPLTLLILAYRGQLAPAKTRATLGTPWQTALQRQRCQIVQADDLAQARLLCRVWQPQAIVLLEGSHFAPGDWDWVAQCPELMQLPWIVLTPLPTACPIPLAMVDGAGILAFPPAAGVVSLIQMVLSTQG